MPGHRHINQAGGLWAETPDGIKLCNIVLRARTSSFHLPLKHVPHGCPHVVLCKCIALCTSAVCLPEARCMCPLHLPAPPLAARCQAKTLLKAFRTMLEAAHACRKVLTCLDCSGVDASTLDAALRPFTTLTSALTQISMAQGLMAELLTVQQVWLHAHLWKRCSPWCVD